MTNILWGLAGFIGSGILCACILGFFIYAPSVVYRCLHRK